EALSAKAQELISRHALDRLVNEDPEDHAGVGARRLWIDPPYAAAKGMLIHAVAEANRCRTALTEKLGFSPIVGDPTDLRAVELLATPQLVPAYRARLTHGRQVDSWGTSSARSFRRSFLMSYAARIGERLRAADTLATEQTRNVDALLPALR